MFASEGQREYTTIETTYEVWKAIKAAHPEIGVYGSYTSVSDVDGGHSEVFTSYGFKGKDFPIMEAVTTWENEVWEDGVIHYKRANEKHRYWLCTGCREDE